MSTFNRISISLALPALFCALTACSDNNIGDAVSSSSSVSSVSPEVAGLEQVINLPVKPLSLTWETNKVTERLGKLDTDDWSVVARMELSEKDLKLLSTVPLPNKVTKLPAYTVEPWMKDIIDTKFKLDETGHFYIPQGTMLSAEQFYQGSLITGAVYMISDTEVLLFLQTDPSE